MSISAFPFRIGQGFDVHALVAGRKLILGGVEIPHDKGLLGHSDADALLHAITDALLGAAGLGDIGRLFPDTDAAYKGADSRVLLRQAYARVREAGWLLVNLDATIIAQAPKISPHAPAMIANLAADLDVPADCINIKGKTNEKMGHLGRGEGIATQAVVLLARKSA
jgi:2-C-methyl-D-erythritol 2,4-cyclodiphosphate synthase